MSRVGKWEREREKERETEKVLRLMITCLPLRTAKEREHDRYLKAYEICTEKTPFGTQDKIMGGYSQASGRPASLLFY